MTRLVFLAVLFATELVALSVSVDGPNLRAGPSLIARALGLWAEPIIHSLITFAGLTATFLYLKKRPVLEAFRRDLKNAHFRSWTLVLHLTLFFGLLATTHFMQLQNAALGTGFVSMSLALGLLVLLSGLATVQSLTLWSRFVRAVGAVWIWAGIPALAVAPMTTSWQWMWKYASAATYWLVQLMLRPVLGTLDVDPSRLLVGTKRFSVIIAPGCSGLEGMGLLLLFGVVWFWFYRKEYRFPHALLVFPIGLVTLFILNSARISALLLIGHAGAQKIAIEGFHSQAGWIAFNGVALGLCVMADRIPWIATASKGQRKELVSINIVAVYLVPFLAILAMGMISRAMTGDFEWAYPLRVLAAVSVFCIYWHEYRAMNWQFSWRGPALGLLVFVMWIGIEWAMKGLSETPMPGALQTAATPIRWGWIAVRLLGGIITVPIAEELAFRGYLLRRLRTELFDLLSPSDFTMWTLVGSSILFGVMHGSRWVAGTAAGLIYALAYIRKGQLGDAVVAHAVSNALVAVAVLGFDYWSLW